MELGWIAGTDGQGAADALVANHARLVEAEAAEFVLAAHWADLHDEDTLTAGTGTRIGPGSGSGRVLPGTERAKAFGGDGTPWVAEFAAAELGCLTGRGPEAAATLVADALDVRHRLPAHWAAVTSGRARVWQVRQVASRTRAVGLSLEQARWVDGELAPYLGSLPWARFLKLVDAKIVEADPEAAEARRVAAALERFVATGQCNEYGLKTVVAKAQAGDAVFFVAMCDRIAQVLLLEGDTDPVGARRSKALGILANPARALALLARYAGTETPEPDEADPDATDLETPVTARDVHPADDDSDDAVDAPATTSPSGDPTAFVKALATSDPKKLLPNATLYIHVSRESFDAFRFGRSVGVARMEGVGPITIDQVREFLRHTNVSVRPVIDLEADHPVDGYEVPDRLREQVQLRTPAGAFPWSGNLSRRRDLDHTVPYVSPGSGGPPAQTRVGNLGPLTRYAHRVKTHGRGWRHHQPVPGVFLWRTPHGYWFRTDHTGTHPLGRHPTDAELAGSPALPRNLRIVIDAGTCSRPALAGSPVEARLSTLVRSR
jgi:hypothetical protein